MKIYADTSFLVSLLYTHDAGHPAAWKFYQANAANDWLTSEWSFFETANSLRQLCVRYGVRPEMAEGLRRYFKNLHRFGPFALAATDWPEMLRDSQQISAACAALLPAASADLLHIAILEQLNPDLFLTRDKKQHALARARAFDSKLIP